MADILYFVVPCYNEEEVLPVTARRLSEKLRQLVAEGLAANGSRILFVDDGSSDGTWRLITALAQENPVFTGLKLSRNRGHQNALLAGLMTAKEYAGAVISLDADLQDDIDAAGDFLKAYYRGNDIVYGVRSDRSSDTFFKRSTAQAFYRLMNAMGVELVYNHADYRLMSRRALDCLEQYREVNLFLRGIVPQIGLRTEKVYYERGERKAGKSKYPLGKMLSFALDGITSFSIKPLRLITVLGATMALVSAAALIISLATGSPELTSAMCSLWLLGGIQLLAAGSVGGYIGKIYAEVKNRPRYFIEQNLAVPNIGMTDPRKFERKIV